MKKEVVIAGFLLLAAHRPLVGQTTGTVDFESQILPLFRQHCISCHGPDQQMGAYRLDRRSVALRADFGPITPTNASASRLYLRLVGNEFGSPMPPSGPLAPGEIEVIRDWIDQGADWPDRLANERDLPPSDPTAVAMTEMLRQGDINAFLEQARRDPALLNARGPNGSTPFMQSVLYGDASLIEELLDMGADPNARDDGNVTAIIWAATDLDKTGTLIARGADVNARSDDSRTALFNAATRYGATPVVRLLLEHGADINPPNRGPADSTPLLEAVRTGDPDLVRLMLENGADAGAVGGAALGTAYLTGCLGCVDLLMAQPLGPAAFTEALFMTVPDGNADTARVLLDNGANVAARDPFGRTPLMYATASDLIPLELVQLLIERGSDVNAVSHRNQETPLGIARRRGDTPIVDLLIASGAQAEPLAVPRFLTLSENSLATAIGRSIPLLQRADASFTESTGCVSCHNNSLPAMAVSLARSTGFDVDEEIARRQVAENVRILSAVREKFHQGVSFADLADPAIFGYILVGLHGEGYPSDASTDAVAMNIKRHQMPDGHWAGPASSVRPPLTNGGIGRTSLGLRALQLYAPNVDRLAYRDAVSRAARWLVTAETRTGGDRSWRLLGLAWADQNPEIIQAAISELLDTQRPDGGWSELDTIDSDAFATGQALVALRTAGLRTSDPAYRRGVRFLLDTQLDDGSWFVQTRALGFQPYFDNGFPHGLSQWISGAGTSWATMALALASDEATGDE